MAEKETIIKNRSDKPDNILVKEYEIKTNCEKLERQMPNFLRGFFSYLKLNVLPLSRYAYLQDIRFFLNYLVNHTDLTQADNIKDIKLDDFRIIEAVDINIFIDYCRQYEIETESSVIVQSNSNTTLSRKKTSLSVMFKQLYRDGLLERNITDGFDPIRVKKAGEREIKALEDDEVHAMLDAVTTGEGLTKKEHDFWKKTKYRDKAILVFFVTYGLRLSELQQLNISSFNFSRGEFKIYRKRDKEAVMPLNMTTDKALHDYLEYERASYDVIEEGHQDALFLSVQGKRLTDRQIRTIVKKYTSIAMKVSRDGGYSPHKLRATAATSLIGRGNSIYDVAALLDHEQVTTTQLYAQHRKNVKKELVKGFEWEESKEKETE